MSITRIKSYGLSNGAVTTEKISNNVSLGVKISNIQIANSAYSVLDDTAIALGGGYIIITGAGFAAGCQVIVGSNTATSTTFVNSTTLRAQVGAADAGTKTVYVVNTDGGTAIRVNGLTYSATPTWVTGSTLTEGGVDEAISIQLSASGATSYQIQTGSSLPAGLSLAANGLLTGTVTGIESETTYNFIVEAIDAENQESPRSFSITITVGEPYFYLTTLLLNGNGTNGANNNTFVDSSNNNFAITRNGNVNQGTFSPFSAPEGRWSNYFDGSGDWLSVPQNSAFNFGTGAFTVEGWFYFWGSFGSIYNGLINLGNGAQGGGPFTGWGLITGGTGTEISWYRFDGTETQYIGNFSFQVGTWYHIVACRNSSSNLAVFVNGTRVVSATSSISFNNVNSDPLNIGYRNDGVSGITHAKIYSSNIRIVAGSAVYDPTQSSITVPTTPLTAITNTSLLTCQSNRFKDNSTNNFAITRNGDVKVTSFSPFRPTGLYSTATNGGSGYFDGSGDFLTLTANAAFNNFGTGDFTIESWFYALGTSAYGLAGTAVFNSNGWAIELNNSGAGYVSFVPAPWSNRIETSSPVYTANTWVHLAITRSSGTITIWINGQSVRTASFSSSITNTANLDIGQFGSGWDARYFFNGYISGFRIVKGSAVYTSTFTPPTSPPTVIASTTVLVNFTNGSIIDYTGKNNLETVGNAQISTSVKKYGTGSIYFNPGQTNPLVIPHTDLLNFVSGDFTIEAWVYLNTNRTYNYLISKGGVSSREWGVNVGPTNLVFYWSTNGTSDSTVSASTSLPTSTWMHIAVTRSGSSIRLFKDGTQVGSTGTFTSMYNGTGTVYIGRFMDYNNISHDLDGYIDDLRITKGFARYTSNFTPPTSAHRLR